MKHRISVFVCIICLLFVGLGNQPKQFGPIGNTYYVSKTGRDSNNGALSSPFLTISHAISVMSAGDTLNIEAGTYNEQVNISNLVGSANAATTIQSFNGETVVIDGTGLNIPCLIYLFNCSYLTLYGLQIQNAPGQGIGCSSDFAGSYNHLSFINLTIYNCGSGGLAVGYPRNFNTKNTLVSGCVIKHVCTLGNGNANEALDIYSTNGFTVENCTLNNTNNVAGIDILEGCQNGSVHNNTLVATTIYIDSHGYASSNINVYDNSISGNGIGNQCMTLGCERNPAVVSNINFYNNLFSNNAGGCLLVYGEAGGFTLANFSFVNNTCYLNAQVGYTDILCSQDQSIANFTNCVIANNIIETVGTTSSPIAIPIDGTKGFIVDHNLLYCANGDLYPQVGGNTYGTDPVLANPSLVNPPTDLSLQSNSPAIDAANGTYAPSTDYIGTTRPQGIGYDIGAYDYVVSTSPAVSTSAASGITTSGATLTGTLTNLGDTSPVTVSFDWGTDQSYPGGNIAGNPSFVASVPTTFTASLSGLIPGTTYHYRAKAVGATTVYGSDQQFTTSTPPTSLAVTTNMLPNGTVGVIYSQTLAAIGGTAPYVWTITSGTLPAGLSLSSSGVISGIPTAVGGPTPITFQVIDSMGATVPTPLLITIARPLGITTSSLPNGTVGVVYSQTLAAIGGTAPYTWTTISGKLPAGLSLSSSGVISGIPTTTDGTAFFTWVITSGKLPAGLTLSSSGIISSTPTAAGGPTSITFQVTDSTSATATKSLSLTITSTLAKEIKLTYLL